MNTTEESPNRYNELSPERRDVADKIINSMASHPYVTWNRGWGDDPGELVWKMRFNVGR